MYYSEAMMKKRWVISVGGSLIIPEEIEYTFLHKLKQTITKLSKKNEFILICGGGHLARTAITALKKEGKSEIEQAHAGIRATRVNALFLMQWFGKKANDHLPLDMKHVKTEIKKNNPVISGALRWTPHATSDTTAAKLAGLLKCPLINLSNTQGLYTADPRTHKKATLITTITWKAFEKKANAIPYKPGQHFILDQQATSIIEEQRVPTFHLSGNMTNFTKCIPGKSFKGTTVNG